MKHEQTDNIGYGYEKRRQGNLDCLSNKKTFRDSFKEMMDSVTKPYSECIQYLVDNIKLDPYFAEFFQWSLANNIPVVSPLAATNPDEFNNPNLISIVNNIQLHAARIGEYIVKSYDPSKTTIVLISTKKSDDEVLGAPLRTFFQQGKGNRFTFEEYSSVYTMEMKMIPGKQYLVLVSSSDKQFVMPTLDKLAKMKNNGSQVELFGHPNWIKQDYNTDKLQALHTRITSSYTVDYKSRDVISFVKKYRKAYNFEPGEYAFKGFDIGFYFGKMLAEHGAGYVKYLRQEKYKGLHNSFEFIRDQKVGYFNTSLSLLEYKNYALNPVE